MRQGFAQRKSQLSEWVFKAARAEADPAEQSAQVAIDYDEFPPPAKKDVVTQEIVKEKSVEFDPQIYLSSSDDKQQCSVEVYYQTRMDMVKGRLNMKNQFLTFEAYKKKHQDENATSQYNLMIDYMDIVLISIIKIPNEEAASHSEKFVRNNYRFNFLIQIEVSAINGLSAVSHSIDSQNAPENLQELIESEDESGAIVADEEHNIIKRSNMSLANIYFKLQHEDTSVMRSLLVNEDQEKVVDLVIEKLQDFVKDAPLSDCSMTYIPFYDTILPIDKRSLLGQVKMSELIAEKVKSILMRALSTNDNVKTNEQKEQKEAMLIKYRPSKSCDSHVLNDF